MSKNVLGKNFIASPLKLCRRFQCDCNARKKSVRSQKIKTQTAIVGVIILQILGLLACPELYYG